MQEWQREVVMFDPATLVPHPRRDEAGERFDTKEAWENLPPNLIALQANILEYGIREPLLIQKGTNYILTGHFRREVAIQDDWPEVPCQVLDVTDEEAFAIMLSDNWERNATIMDDPMAIARNMYYFALRMKMEIKDEKAINRFWHREGNVTSFSNEVVSIIGKKFDLSKGRVRVYFQLLKLIPELQQLVSWRRIGLEGGASLGGMSEKAQQNFLRDYANYVKVSDLEIKSFKDTWQDISDEQRERLTKSETAPLSMDAEQEGETEDANDRTSRSVETDANEIGEGQSQADDDEDDFYEAFQAQSEDLKESQNELHAPDMPISTSVTDPDDLPSISVMDDPKHRTLHMRNKLSRLVKRQKGALHRMNGELRDLIDGLKEDTEEQGLLYIMEDVEQLEVDAQTMLDLIKKAKAQHQEAINRHSEAMPQGV